MVLESRDASILLLPFPDPLLILIAHYHFFCLVNVSESSCSLNRPHSYAAPSPVPDGGGLLGAAVPNFCVQCTGKCIPAASESDSCLPE